MAPKNYTRYCVIKTIDNETKEIKNTEFAKVCGASISSMEVSPLTQIEPLVTIEVVPCKREDYYRAVYSKALSGYDCSGFATYSASPVHVDAISSKIDYLEKKSGDTDGDHDKVNDLICLDIDRVIFNDPATIIFWKDGSKTVVKCTEGQTFNKYYGFCAAVTKHIIGNNSLVNKLVNEGFDDVSSRMAKAPHIKNLKKFKPKKEKKGKKND